MTLNYDNSGVCDPEDKMEEKCILYDKKAGVK